MRRSTATAALLLALCLGASAARELQGAGMMDDKKAVAGAAWDGTKAVAGAAWDGTKAVAGATAGAVGGVVDAKHAKISGMREAHEAKVSGMRAAHAAKVSALRAHLYGEGGMTPTATPAECLSVAELAQKAGNFSVLLAAAEVSGKRGCGRQAVGRWRASGGGGGAASGCAVVPARLRAPALGLLRPALALLPPCSALLSRLPHAPNHPATPHAQAAGLAGALSDRSLQATVFAPTDDAFALLLAQLDLTAADLLKQPALLQKVGA